MPAILTIGIFLLLGVIPYEVYPERHVDVIERNHFYNPEDGKLCFTQLVFRDFYDDGHYHVRGWCLEKSDVTEMVVRNHHSPPDLFPLAFPRDEYPPLKHQGIIIRFPGRKQPFRHARYSCLLTGHNNDTFRITADSYYETHTTYDTETYDRIYVLTEERPPYFTHYKKPKPPSEREGD